ncbi:hypothetical protein AVEN_76854-1 [Araneus ventricosus]|uniref:Uncharacterized protein n=1 Tax=Araneus ventricosus TaxID=182803 RepID=A0A4Y2Q949_ARAVE|nr:hypothetical protein AVEN_76854-1 [Araneus ventricosus]
MTSIPRPTNTPSESHKWAAAYGLGTAGVEVWRVWCRLRYRPRHLIKSFCKRPIFSRYLSHRAHLQLRTSSTNDATDVEEVFDPVLSSPNDTAGKNFSTSRKYSNYLKHATTYSKSN